MDAKDVKIFCEITFKGIDYDSYIDRRISPSTIGKKVGMDEKTVRLRVKKMENDGFIKYYQVIPRLGLFSFKLIDSYRFQALNVSTKHNLIQFVSGLPFVTEVTDYLGNTVTVSITGNTSKEIEDMASKIASRFELFKWRLGRIILNNPKLAPDKLDWKLIQKLRYDALASINELATSLVITTRMTGYRITRLLESDMVIIRAIIDSQKQRGLIFYELEIAVNKRKSSEIINQLSQIYAYRIWSIRTLTDRLFIISMFAFTLAEPEATYINVQKNDGVCSVSLYIFKEMIEVKKTKLDRQFNSEES